MARSKSDPLIAALIAKLPASGSEWPVDKQLAWLNLMAMAFGAVYGGDAAARLAGVKIEAAPDPAPAAKPAPPPKPKPPKHPFYIDEDGFVRRANGKQVLPSEVTDMVVDLRGEDGDLRTIIWADGSVGLNGADLTIVGA